MVTLCHQQDPTVAACFLSYWLRRFQFFEQRVNGADAILCFVLHRVSCSPRLAYRVSYVLDSRRRRVAVRNVLMMQLLIKRIG